MNLNKSLNVVTLEQNGVSAAIIPAAEMARLQHAQDIIDAARQRAVGYLRVAREQRMAQRARYRRRLAQQKRAWRKQYQRLFDQAKQDGVSASLVWLVEQEQWKSQACQHLTREIVQLLSARLKKISQRFPWQELLAEQIKPLCEELQNNGPLILTVAGSLFHQLPDEITGLPLKVECDDRLAPGDACLENQLIRIELRLPGQIELLSDALLSLSWEQLHEPD